MGWLRRWREQVGSTTDRYHQMMDTIELGVINMDCVSMLGAKKDLGC